MKPYGIDKLPQNPDVVDIKYYAMPSRVGKIIKKGRDYRPYSRSNARKFMRRYWRKRGRRESNVQKEEY